MLAELSEVKNIETNLGEKTIQPKRPEGKKENK